MLIPIAFPLGNARYHLYFIGYNFHNKTQNLRVIQIVPCLSLTLKFMRSLHRLYNQYIIGRKRKSLYKLLLKSIKFKNKFRLSITMSMHYSILGDFKCCS